MEVSGELLALTSSTAEERAPALDAAQSRFPLNLALQRILNLSFSSYLITILSYLRSYNNNCNPTIGNLRNN
jgi:hypothetical protein